jgi:16S rRNA C967 or C1407 C5-methylase (RsmB/RsmF family)
MDDSEFEQMISVYRTPLPNVFRLSSKTEESSRAEHELLEQIQKLGEQGIVMSEIDSLPVEHGRIYRLPLDKAVLRRDPKYQDFRSWLNLQTSLGRCHRQEFVSMIPPHFLGVEPGNSVLDTCAAPGSKTAQILEMLGDSGLVVANDLDPRRCHALVHQLQRVGTMNALVVCDQAQFIDFRGHQFDRVLCDVPCSGDGTLRKNPSAGAKWQVRGATALHGLQRAILRRGLELAKPGGIIVYSTCSMNPVEDEAVVNSVLLEIGDAIEIVDCGDRFPLLKRHRGLKKWRVYDDLKTEGFAVSEEVPRDKKQWANDSMFSEPQVEGLERCMRFYPHDADSGGFFVSVLRKLKDFERKSKPPLNEPKDLREAPYLPIEQVAPEVLAELRETFGLGDSFPGDQLFVRDEKSVNNICYIGREISQWIREHGSAAFRTISCGCPIFIWRRSGPGAKASIPHPAFEGLRVVMKYATKRVFQVTPSDMKKLLFAGHRAVGFQRLSSEALEKLKDAESSGCVLEVPNTIFAYPGMSFRNSIGVYLRKDLLEVEIKKLLMTFPELGSAEEVGAAEGDLRASGVEEGDVGLENEKS